MSRSAGAARGAIRSGERKVSARRISPRKSQLEGSARVREPNVYILQKSLSSPVRSIDASVHGKKLSTRDSLRISCGGAANREKHARPVKRVTRALAFGSSATELHRSAKSSPSCRNDDNLGGDGMIILEGWLAAGANGNRIA